MKKLLSFCLFASLLSLSLLASEGSSSGASSSSAGSSAASSSSSVVDLSKTTATIVTHDGTIELKKPVLLNVAGGSIELSPLQVWVLKSGLINGLLFEKGGELEEALDFREKVTLKVAKIIASILDTAVRAGADENALKSAIEKNITAENALSVIYVLRYLDSPLAGQIIQFVSDAGRMVMPKDENECCAVLLHKEMVGQALCVALLPCWTCIKSLEGLGHCFNQVAFSPDGKRLAGGGDGNTVRIWDVSSGACKQTLKGHNKAILAVTFSPDGKYVASGGDDNAVRIWDVSSGACKKVLEGHSSAILAVTFSPDGKHVASGGEDTTVRIWDVSSGVCKQTLKGHGKAVWSVAFSPDGKHVVSGGADKTVCVWDMDSGVRIKTLKGHDRMVWSVAFSPDGKYVASGSADKTVCIWDMSSGDCKQVFKGHEDCVRAVAFSHDGKHVISGNLGETTCIAVRIWDMNSGACIKMLKGHGALVDSLVFSPDGECLASGSNDGTVRIWGLSDEWRSLSVLAQWHMLVRNAQKPFKDCMDAVLCATVYKISDLMRQHEPADVVQRFFEEHKSAFGERCEEVAADVARYKQEFLRERWAERFDGASSSKDS